jgi:branched-subunit amino acid transport protein
MTRYEWVLILGMMVVTFGIRYFLLAFAGRIKLPPLVEASLNYIPPAVLMAMTVPAVLLPKGELHVSYTNPYLVAAILATAAGLLTRSLLATIAIGLMAFFAFQLLV